MCAFHLHYFSVNLLHSPTHMNRDCIYAHDVKYPTKKTRVEVLGPVINYSHLSCDKIRVLTLCCHFNKLPQT